MSPRTKGFILPVVLLVLAALSAMAAMLISGTRTEVAIARNIRAAAEIEALADAGIFRAMSVLAQRAYPQTRDPPDNWRFGGGNLNIFVEPESGKIDLNKGHQDLLAGLLENAGMSRAQAKQSAVRMDAYRDPRAGRYFTSVDQFGAIFNLDRKMIENIRPLVTVYTGLEGFTPGAAQKGVLAAIPGFRESGIASILANRGDSSLFAPEDLALLQRYTVEGIAVYTIIVEATSGGDSTFRRLAVVNMTDAGKPVFYEWRQQISDIIAPGLP